MGWRGCVRTRKTLGGGGTTFVWLIHARLGGGLLVTAFQHGLFLAKPLAQHILIIILLLSHFKLFYSSTDQNPRYSNLLRIQLADQRAVMVTLTRLPLVSRVVQRILQAKPQRTKEPNQKEREKRKEREKERKGL